MPIAEKTSRALASRKTSESGSLASAGRSEPGSGAARLCAISDSSRVLPSSRTAILARSCVRVSCSSCSMSALAGIELGGELVFDQRLFELAGRRRAGGARGEVILRGAQLRAFEALLGVAAVGILAQQLGVFGDGEVVVLRASRRCGRRVDRAAAASRTTRPCRRRARPGRDELSGRVSY